MARARQAPLNPTVRGAQYRQTFQAMVNTIAGASAPPVYSRGARFYNVDRWTARMLTKEFCEWAKANPKCVPTRDDIAEWVRKANEHRVPVREIVVANCPDRLPRSILYGIQGGGCHEGFHTRYSCRRELAVDEVADIVLTRWPKIPDWAQVYALLQDWSNLVEDIRIERLGRVEYPGTDPYLHDLQDFILMRESAGLQDARAHAAKAGKKPKRNKLTIILGAFRDYGLGYKTEIQAQSWRGYLREDSDGVNFVMQGPLRPLVEEALCLTEQDDLGCLRVAMDCIIELAKAGETDTSGGEAEQGEQGDGEQACKKCGAPPHKLVVRPKSDGSGGQLEGKGICTCIECGHQEEVNVTTRKRPQEQTEKTSGPQWEGWDFEEEEDFDGKSEASQPADGESPSGAGGEGHRNTAQQALQEAAAGENSELMDSNLALSQAISEEGDREIGHVRVGEQPYRPWDPSLDLVNIIKPKNPDAALKRAQALLESVKAECSYLRARLRSIARALEMTDTIHGVPRGRSLSERMLVDTHLTIQAGDQPRRAYYETDKQFDLSMAVAVVIDESGSMGLSYGKAVQGCMGDGNVGCPRCGSLDITVGHEPRQRGSRLSRGLAVCGGCSYKETVKVRSKKEEATRMLLAIAEPCERLGYAVQCSGFRDGLRSNRVVDKDRNRFHRFDGKTHDVFKRFDEKLRNVLARFAEVKAVGSTPLADGIQFGLDSLNYRDEAHRVLIVLTDGEPTEGHRVIPWQLRTAKEAGIHVIGVGIGAEAKGVKTRFDDWVWDEDLSVIPKLLIKKLNDIIDVRAIKRGRRLAKPT